MWTNFTYQPVIEGESHFMVCKCVSEVTCVGQLWIPSRGVLLAIVGWALLRQKDITNLKSCNVLIKYSKTIEYNIIASIAYLGLIIILELYIPVVVRDYGCLQKLI